MKETVKEGKQGEEVKERNDEKITRSQREGYAVIGE